MTRAPFEYAVMRAVPRVDRGECINVGVLLYCQATDFLAARWHVDPHGCALDANVDVAAVEAALAAVDAVCEATSDAGPAANQAPGSRFRWPASPRSTVLQVGPIHVGVTADAAAELERLFGALVPRP